MFAGSCSRFRIILRRRGEIEGNVRLLRIMHGTVDYDSEVEGERGDGVGVSGEVGGCDTGTGSAMPNPLL